MDETILLLELYAVFSKIERVSYGSSIEMRSDFKADTEKIYNCLQKELNAQAKVGMN